MAEINKEELDFIDFISDKYEARVEELKARNKVIGNEATLKDVLQLFDDFFIDNSKRSQFIRAYTINEVLGGGN